MLPVFNFNDKNIKIKKHGKKNKKTSLLTKQLEIRDDIPQLITGIAIEHFHLLKKANVDIYLQIAILKEYTDRYYLEKIYYNEALPAIESDPKLAKELKSFLSKVHEFCTTEACGSKEENQARLQKVRDRR
ncbi:MAG: hypothetical protein E6K54_05520 [Gammaproteobacteria bacterium]|nr:MAG: hypothetical protein E6K54_05520 [Gammaproteobacteria bacterium]